MTPCLDLSEIVVRDIFKRRAAKVNSKTVQKITTESTALRKRRRKGEEYLPSRLVAFPIYDKSDAMLYLPSTYARLVNSGELDELAKLMKGYCQKDCNVCLHPLFNVTVPHYLQILEFVNMLHPDSVMCMHSTRVVGNQIQAVLYHKHTDAPEMHHFADSIVNDPSFKYYFVGPRIDILKRNFKIATMKPEKRNEILSVLYLEEEFEVYGKVDLTITFDETSKKIVDMQYFNSYTSICHDGVQYPFL